MKMTLLLNGVTQLLDQETYRAEQLHGKTFVSFPEAFTALAEEVQEMQDETHLVEDDMQSILRMNRDLAQNGQLVMNATLINLERHALLAACEMIQVAHVARKMLLSQEGFK